MNGNRSPERQLCEIHNRYFAVGSLTCVICDLEADLEAEPIDETAA